MNKNLCYTVNIDRISGFGQYGHYVNVVDCYMTNGTIKQFCFPSFDYILYPDDFLDKTSGQIQNMIYNLRRRESTIC